MSIFVHTLPFAFFTFPVYLEQFPLDFKQLSSLSICSNSCFLQKCLQQVLYVTAKSIAMVSLTTNQQQSCDDPTNNIIYYCFFHIHTLLVLTQSNCIYAR